MKTGKRSGSYCEQLHFLDRGKKALREEIVRRFLLSYEKYIEVFGGAGWVLFHKPPGREEEFFNDYNPNLTNLYLCVQDKQLKEELKAQLRAISE